MSSKTVTRGFRRLSHLNTLTISREYFIYASGVVAAAAATAITMVSAMVGHGGEHPVPYSSRPLGASYPY